MKVIALNSGGFDSVVMINDLLANNVEVISLFFNWGQPNYEQEKLCAEKIGARCSEHIEVKVNMPWVNTNMSEKAYIPMRNLVFGSYAVSLAEQRNIPYIYMAVINTGNDVPYFDCTQDFYNNLNHMIEGKGIEIRTPYIDFRKQDLKFLYYKYKMTKDDFFSCNTPMDNKPCMTCGDCTSLKALINPPVYLRTDFETEDFKEEYFRDKIEEVRLLINNECQFTCKHCFYGCGEEKMPRFSTEEFKDVIRQCYDELIVDNIHFSGKEPMIDDTIFELTDYIDENYKDKTYDIVTNGATLEKYLDKVKKCKNLRKMYLSVDTLTEETTLRNTNKHIVKNIKMLVENNIPLQVTLDLNKHNVGFLKDTLIYLEALGVRDVYIRNLKPNGEAKDIQDIILNAQEFGEALDTIYAIDFKTDIVVTAYINKDLKAEAEDTSLEDYIYLAQINKWINYNLYINLEHYCGRYMSNITITPDGYVLGCAMDVSVPHYDQLSGGNLHTDNIVDCLYRGRTEHLNKFICKSCKKGCTFTN